MILKLTMAMLPWGKVKAVNNFLVYEKDAS